MIFLDTTVLMYSVGDDHRFRSPCLNLMAAVHDGRLEATTTVEVIQEFAHVRARRRNRADAADLATQMAVTLSPLRETDQEHLREGIDLWSRHRHIGSFDAVLAAVARDSKYATLVSADRGFAGIDGLHHVFPDEEGVASLLG